MKNITTTNLYHKAILDMTKKLEKLSQAANESLIGEMRKSKVLKSPQIIKAFKTVSRIDFVPEDFKDSAYLDVPVPIPEGMTTSQPSTIAFMLELLQARPEDKILEVGTGSGYLTALLADLVGGQGEVHSVELLPRLNEFANNNLRKYRYKNVMLYIGDGRSGIPEIAPFDKIISGAEVGIIPEEWKRQLKVGGVIITPFDDHVLKVEKISEKEYRETEFPNFSFVKML